VKPCGRFEYRRPTKRGGVADYKKYCATIMCAGFGRAVVVGSAAMEDGRWCMADALGAGESLTLILCRLGTTSGFSSDSIPPKGRGDLAFGAASVPSDSGLPRDRHRGEGLRPGIHRGRFLQGRIANRGRITKRTQFRAGRRGNLCGRKPKTNPISAGRGAYHGLSVLKCCMMWIRLMDNVLASKVCHFVTWLHFSGNGFVCGEYEGAF
jgi:hypothetical protein